MDAPELFEFLKLEGEVLYLAVFDLLGEFFLKLFTTVPLLCQNANQLGDVASDFAVVLTSLTKLGDFSNGSDSQLGFMLGVGHVGVKERFFTLGLAPQKPAQFVSEHNF